MSKSGSVPSGRNGGLISQREAGGKRKKGEGRREKGEGRR
jgi:hypothetical protein